MLRFDSWHCFCVFRGICLQKWRWWVFCGYTCFLFLFLHMKRIIFIQLKVWVITCFKLEPLCSWQQCESCFIIINIVDKKSSEATHHSYLYVACYWWRCKHLHKFASQTRTNTITAAHFHKHSKQMYHKSLDCCSRSLWKSIAFAERIHEFQDCWASLLQKGHLDRKPILLCVRQMAYVTEVRLNSDRGAWGCTAPSSCPDVDLDVIEEYLQEHSLEVQPAQLPSSPPANMGQLHSHQSTRITG